MTTSLPVLYEYAVILDAPEDEKGNRGPSSVLVPPTTVLCQDEGAAQLRAARAIPDVTTEGLTVDLDLVRVVVRPF